MSWKPIPLAKGQPGFLQHLSIPGDKALNGRTTGRGRKVAASSLARRPRLQGEIVGMAQSWKVDLGTYSSCVTTNHLLSLSVPPPVKWEENGPDDSSAQPLFPVSKLWTTCICVLSTRQAPGYTGARSKSLNSCSHPGGRHYYCHARFTDEETETLGSEISCSSSPSMEMTAQGLKSRP